MERNCLIPLHAVCFTIHSATEEYTGEPLALEVLPRGEGEDAPVVLNPCAHTATGVSPKQLWVVTQTGQIQSYYYAIRKRQPAEYVLTAFAGPGAPVLAAPIRMETDPMSWSQRWTFHRAGAHTWVRSGLPGSVLLTVEDADNHPPRKGNPLVVEQQKQYLFTAPQRWKFVRVLRDPAADAGRDDA